MFRSRAGLPASTPSWARMCMAATATVALASGCIDPDAKYQDFVDRTYTPRDAGPSTCPDIGDTPLPEPEQLAGTYYYVVHLPPYEPAIYLLEVEAFRNGTEYTHRQRNRPLKFADKKTQTGEWSEWVMATVEAAGCYELEDVETVTPMDASPLMTDVTTLLTFSGNVGGAIFEDGPTSLVKFWCGHTAGEVTNPPLGLKVNGTFTATRLADVNNTAAYPEIATTCPANPS